MATSVRGPDARPAAGSCCKFELKEYKTVFTCCVCMMDIYEAKRYRCDHCDLARHERCIQLDNKIKMKSTYPINWKGKEVELHDEPQIRGKDLSTQNWAGHCTVCGMLIKHYSYHYLNDMGMDMNMHPYCAYLAQSDGSSSSTHKLEARQKNTCLWCRRERPIGACLEENSCWSYLLKESGRDWYIHVHCYSEMVIQALKGIIPSKLSSIRRLRIVLKPKESDGGTGSSVWEAIAEEAVGLALDQFLGGGGGLIPIIIKGILH